MNLLQHTKFSRHDCFLSALLITILMAGFTGCSEDNGTGIDLNEELYLEEEIPETTPGMSSSNPFAPPGTSSVGVSSSISFPGNGGESSSAFSSSSYSFGVPGSSVNVPGTSSSAVTLQDSAWYYSTYFSPESCVGLLCDIENFGSDWNYSLPIAGNLPNFSSTSFNNVKVVSGEQDMSGVNHNLLTIENFSWDAGEGLLHDAQENHVTGRFTWSGGSKDFRTCQIDFRYYKGAHITISGTSTIMDGVFWVDMTNEPRFIMVDTTSAYAIEWY